MLKWKPYKGRLLACNYIYAKRIEMALPVPTKLFLQLSPDTAIPFAPFGCTHLPVLLFLLVQNPFSKNIAGSDIMK